MTLRPLRSAHWSHGRRTSALLSAIFGVVALSAAAPAPRASTRQGACRAGEKLEVEWHGTWYPATVKAGPNAAGACQIGYDGYGTNWDEWVGAARMRRGGAPKAAPAPTPARAEVAAGPLADGEYDCATGTGTFQHPMVRFDGRFDVRGLTYRFRPFGNVTDGYASYAVNADRTIRWGGHVGGFTERPAVIVESTKEPFGFNVKYRSKPGGYVETMSCHKM